MAVISSSQRLQEVSTKFRSKMDFLVGRTTLDDYELKIRRMLRHSKHRQDVLSLEVGSFLWCPSDNLIEFPKFKQQGEPFEITGEFYEWMKPKRTLKDKIKRAISKLLGRSHSSTSYSPNKNETSRAKL